MSIFTDGAELAKAGPVVEADYDFEWAAFCNRNAGDSLESQVLEYRVQLDWLAKTRQKEVRARGDAAVEDPIWNDIIKDWADLVELLMPEGPEPEWQHP